MENNNNNNQVINAEVLANAKMPELRTLGKTHGLKTSGKGITAEVLREQLKAFVTEVTETVVEETKDSLTTHWAIKEKLETLENGTTRNYSDVYQVVHPIINILNKQECLDICKRIFYKSTTGTPRLMYVLYDTIPDLIGKYAVTHKSLYHAVSSVMISHQEYRDHLFINDVIIELCQKKLVFPVTRTGGGKFYLVNNKLIKKFLDANREQPKQGEQVTEQPPVATEEDIPVVDEALLQ